MVQPDKAARVFKVLSVESRVRLIELLKQRSLCVNALARFLSITPAAVSQHLRVLRDAEVVIADKQGYHVHYRINPDTLAEWAGIAGSVLQADGVRERIARGFAGTDGQTAFSFFANLQSMCAVTKSIEPEVAMSMHHARKCAGGEAGICKWEGGRGHVC